MEMAFAILTEVTGDVVGHLTRYGRVGGCRCHVLPQLRRLVCLPLGLEDVISFSDFSAFTLAKYLSLMFSDTENLMSSLVGVATRSPGHHVGHLWFTLLTCLAPDNIRSFTTLYEMVLSNLENTFLSFSSPRLSPKFLMKTLPTPLLLREGSRWLHMILMLVQYLMNVCFLDWDQFLQNLLLALLADVLSPDSLEGFHAAGVSM